MSFDELIAWMKRATGLWYQPYGPISDTVPVEQKAAELRHRTDRIVREVDQLERELRKIGVRIPSSYSSGD